MSQLFSGCMNDIICYVDINTYHKLAEDGNIDMLKFMHSFSPKNVITKTVMYAAISGGQLKIMNFLRINVYQWDGDEWIFAKILSIKHFNKIVLDYIKTYCLNSCQVHFAKIIRNKRD